jgi:hypothetical protein
MPMPDSRKFSGHTPGYDRRCGRDEFVSKCFWRAASRNLLPIAASFDRTSLVKGTFKPLTNHSS